MAPVGLAIDDTSSENVRLTVGEFVVWSERRSDGARHELVDGRPVEMQAERNSHALVKAEVWRLLRDAVRAANLPCTVLPDGVTVAVEDFRARRPDVTMQCESGVDPDALTCDAPLLLVEVASPSTARVDTTAKLAEYMSLDSIRHYVIIDPDARLAYHHSRASFGGDILTRIVTDGAIEIDPPGISIVLAACFVEVDLLERRG